MFSTGDRASPGMPNNDDNTGQQLQSQPSSTIQNQMESGVAQIANIGSIISSTFGAFNEKFARYDNILENEGYKTDNIGEEFMKQKKSVSSLTQTVIDIQEQMKSIISAVQQLEARVSASGIEGESVAALLVPDPEIEARARKLSVEILAQKEDMSEKEQQQLIDAEFQADILRKERAELIIRIGDLETEMKLVRRPSFKVDLGSLLDDGAPMNKVDLISQRDLHVEEKSEIDKKIDEIEETMLRISSRPGTAKKPDLLVIDEDLAIEVEPTEPLTEQQILQQKLDSAIAMSSVKSMKELQEAIQMQAIALEETQAQEPREPINARKSMDSTPVAGTAVSSAVTDRHEVAIEELQTIVANLSTTLTAERQSSAEQKEKSTSRITQLESNITTNNVNYLAHIKDLAERLQDLQDGAQSSLGTSLAIKRLQLAMNDVIAEVDELKYRSSVADSMEKVEQTGPSGNQDHLGTASLLLDIEINSVKQKLLELRDDLDNGLDTYADAHAADPEGSEAFESVFIARVAEFADRLDNVIMSFQPRETPELTLIALFQPLDALTIELEALFELDQQSVASMGITFDDVTAEGSSRNVRDTMRLVWDVSLPLLDHRVNKITMRRRLTALEEVTKGKADTAGINALEAELRRLVTAKADQKELLMIASKKVSLGELQRLKDQLMKQIVSIRGYEYSNTGGGEGGQSPREGGSVTSSAPVHRNTENTSEMNVELKQLVRRFEILHSFHEDLAEKCTGFVPREEVEQALRALLGEMKLMKSNTISPDLLRESLKSKASVIEVQKLVSALTSALGDITGNKDVASAVYSRCLICDKPVKSLVLAPLTSNKGPRAFSPDRQSSNQYSAGGYYDKSVDRGILERPSTIATMTGQGQPSVGSMTMDSSVGFAAAAWGPPTSPPRTNTNSPPTSMKNTVSAPDLNNTLDSKLNMIKKNPARTSTEYKITRNAMDLPPLQSPISSVPGKGGKGGAVVYKLQGQGRIRSQGAAGGGMQTAKYELDTR